LYLSIPILEFSKIIQSDSTIHVLDYEINKVVYDSRKIVSGKDSVFFALLGSHRDGHSFIQDAYQKGVKVFVVSCIPEELQLEKDIQFIVVKNTLHALQSLATYHRKRFSYPVIAITGSLGKTIVKEWLYICLSDKFSIVRSPKSYNTPLGVALSILEMDTTHTLAIFEAGISSPGEMDVLEAMIQPTYGIFTSFGKAHASNFKDDKVHLEEKLRLFRNTKKTWFSSSILVNELYTKLESYIQIPTDKTSEIIHACPFQDEVSIQNCSTVAYVSSQFGLVGKKLIDKIKLLPRLALRMETYEGIQNTFIINDTYNLDLDALIYSLEYQLMVSKEKRRIAIISTEGLSEKQKEEVKSILYAFKLDGLYFVEKETELPVKEINNATVLIKGTRSAQLQRIALQFTLKKHKTRLEINLSSIKHNISFFRNHLAANTKLLSMIKASSYGSGAVKIAQYLQQIGVEYIGVAYADEGVELRKNGVTLPILVMSTEEDGFEDIVKYQLEPAIYSLSILDSFIRYLIYSEVENYPIHVKIDTGMRRLGFLPNELDKLVSVLKTQPEVYVKSVYSHLADADNATESNFTNRQIETFNASCSFLESHLSSSFWKHLCNSEAITEYPNAHYDMVRLGIGMYGYSTKDEVRTNLKQAISWRSVVTQIKEISKGESIGYSRSFIANKKMKIAIIPVGYADGFRKLLGNGIGGVYIGDNYCPTVGNVCMDMIMVDVTQLSVQEGEEVEILGKNQSLVGFAKKMQTIPYEVLTSISPRVHRVYIDE
jgi:alanine racemase